MDGLSDLTNQYELHGCVDCVGYVHKLVVMNKLTDLV